MTRDITAILWKEWREMLAQPGGWLVIGWRSNLATAVILGVYVVFFLAPFSSSTIAAAGAGAAGGFLALIQAGDSLAGERERHTLEALLSTNVSGSGLYLGKALAVALYGWAFGVVVLLASVVTTFVRGTGGLPVGSLPVAALAALPLVVPTAMLGILVSARSATVRQAHQTVTSVILIVIAAPSLLIGGIVALVPRDGELPAWLRGLVQRLLPLAELGTTGWLMVAVAVALLLSVVLFLLGRASFERDRLSSV